MANLEVWVSDAALAESALDGWGLERLLEAALQGWFRTHEYMVTLNECEAGQEDR